MSRRRKKVKPLDYAALGLNRTVGIEIEGYIKENPRRIINAGGIANCEIKRDGSLANSHWSDSTSGMHGVEIVTVPLKSLEPLGKIFETITSKGWSASGRASTHIHVDASDYTFYDRLKMAHFAKRVEDVMLLFTKDRRYDNGYCRLLSPVWTKVLTNKDLKAKEHINNLYELRNSDVFRNTQMARDMAFDRYRWANIFSTKYPTIEFRMFHPVRKAEDAAKFAYLVHNFVNLVKETPFDQLEYIADEIENEPSIKMKVRMLLDVMMIPYKIPVINSRATAAIIDKQKAKLEQLTPALIV